MLAMPGVGVLPSDPRQIGTGSLGAPLEGVIEHRLGGERVMAVTLLLVPKGADHLRMTGIAAFALVDVASRQFQGCIGTDTLADGPVPLLLARRIDGHDRLPPRLVPNDLGKLFVLHGVLHIEERDDLHQPPDR